MPFDLDRDKLEPSTPVGHGMSYGDTLAVVAYSHAVSAKRQADALERLAAHFDAEQEQRDRVEVKIDDAMVREADALEAIAASLATIAQHLAPVTAVNAKASNWIEETVGWIEWHGGECPVPYDTRVDVMFRSSVKPSLDLSAQALNWGRLEVHSSGGDIVAYRLAPAR